ncbi:hypothetical protein INS90_00705 [Trueperella pecoris]|uniref:Uncharacterized protein n=1 Tax=Trueperella pecoris TaxID=2733571 RepID=A0A7M1R0S6_9ACTO|nr:hypothetical protein [Trueperella pecoris]QOR47869.1 hypothetical protein INS90_00705 [Trueperella pecoris]
MVTFQLAISHAQADAFLTSGYDLFSGFAVDAAAAASVTEVADLMDLLCLRFPGSPYAEDEPIDILHVPSDPFTLDRKAVGPLHPEAFRGGVVEYFPFDGSGVARGGGVETDLLLVDPARVTTGSRLWRFYPGNPTPELRGIYHGIAYGWENVAEGTFTATVPSPFLGPVIRREWGGVPCDVEVEGGQPVAVTMVSPSNPSQESGFEELESGMWAKRIEVGPDAEIFTDFVTGELSGIPVRVVRSVRDGDSLLFQVASMFTDALFLERARFQRWSTGIYTALVDPAHLTMQQRQEAKPVTWDVADRPAVATRGMQPTNFSDPNELLRETFGLMAQTAPPSWEDITLRLQIVGESVIYEGYAQLEGDQNASLRVIPTAICHHMRRLKQDRVLAGEDPFLVAVININNKGEGKLNVNAVQEPVWADLVPAEEWRNELAAFPRSADNMPDWLLDRAARDHLESTSREGSPFPADLTAGIHWIHELIGEDDVEAAATHE